LRCSREQKSPPAPTRMKTSVLPQSKQVLAGIFDTSIVVPAENYQIMRDTMPLLLCVNPFSCKRLTFTCDRLISLLILVIVFK
jgi:hypothetical protein